MEKGRKASIGEIRTWNNGKKYQKTVNGWVPVKQGSKQEEEPIEYEEFVDEDTGEIVKLPKRKQEEVVEEEASSKEEVEKYMETRKREKELLEAMQPFEDEIWNCQEDLRSVKIRMREAERDQEEEIGRLYAEEEYMEAERKAQEYGALFEELEEAVQNLYKRIEEANKKLEPLQKEFSELWID